MKIALNQKQMDFLKSDHLNTGFVAGLGSGKSFVSTLKTIMKKVKYKESTVAYYLPTYGLIRDIAFDKFPTMLTEMGYKYRLNKSDKEIHIDDFGKIIFRSMENPENIVGYETFYTLIDECDILPMEKMTTAYNKILGRNRQVIEVEDKNILENWSIPMRLPKGTYWHIELKKLCWSNQLDIVGTPEGFKFFYQRYVTEINNKTDTLIKASTYENKHLPPNYIKGLEQQYPENLLKAYLKGEFVNLTSGTIYSYFNRDKHHSDEVENEYEQLIIGQDFNVGGCISIVYIKRGNTYIAVNEFSSYDTRAVIQTIKQNYPNRSLAFYPDASGNNRKTTSDSDIAMIRQEGFMVYVNSTNPAVKDRINATNNAFEKGLLKVNTKRCPQLTKAFEQHSYTEKGEPEKFNTAGSVDDYTDSGTYPIAYLMPVVKPYSRARMTGY